MRVIGSHAISTRPSDSDLCEGSGMIVVIDVPLSVRGRRTTARDPERDYQVRVAPVVSFVPRLRQCGSLSNVFLVILRKLRMADPYSPDAVVESLPPGGSS